MMLSLVDAQQSRLGATHSSLCDRLATSDWATRVCVRPERRLVGAKRLASRGERPGEGSNESRVRVQCRTKPAQGQIPLPLPFPSNSAFLLLPPPPPIPPWSPSTHPFLLHPAHPACFNLWQTTESWHRDGATGGEAAHALRGGDKRRETPPDVLLRCRSVPVQLCWCANAARVLQG